MPLRNLIAAALLAIALTFVKVAPVLAWDNWSWGSQVDNINGNPVSWTPTAWGGLYFHENNTLDALEIKFHLQTSNSSQKFWAFLYDQNNNQIGDSKLEITASGDYSLAIKQPVKGFALQEATGQSQPSVTVSNINLVKKSQLEITFYDENNQVVAKIPLDVKASWKNYSLSRDGTMINNFDLPAPAPVPIVVPAGVGYSVSGGSIFKSNEKINLHGINWFGFETDTHVVHGLWSRGYKDMISQMKNLGFNAVRLPFCPASVNGAPVTAVDYAKNPDLKDLNSIQVMDKIIGELNSQGVYILLDSHRPDCNAQSNLWYTGFYSESQWMGDLVTLAKRYAGVANFIGLDLKNEPHGEATWGTGNEATDWNLAAERAGKAVLDANQNILVMVAGIGDNPICQDNNAHFWGGNLAPVKCKTLNLPESKYILSPHVYGPDVAWQSYFGASDFPKNMPEIWEAQWGYLAGKNAVVVGEWGGRNDFVWQNALVGYMKSKSLCSSFYWNWNPNSGDTGGVLQDDWSTPVSTKVSMLQSYFNSCR